MLLSCFHKELDTTEGLNNNKNAEEFSTEWMHTIRFHLISV